MSQVPLDGAASEPVRRAVRFVDLHQQLETADGAIRRALDRVLQSGQFILGAEVEAFEIAAADYCDADYAIGCASGSDALLLSLMALDLQPGDEVVTTPYSFFATASSIWRLGARPVFADIDPETLNVDPCAVEAAIGPRTRALLPVHLFGQCAEMEPLWRLGAQHALPILEDAAQAFGAGYRGRRAGVLGSMGAFSFFPTKNLGALGEAGMITTDDAHLAKRLRQLRVHGMEPKYHHQEVGINSRLDAIQAAVLAAKLPYLDAWTEARRRNAQRYRQWFDECGLLDYVQLPVERADVRHVFSQFVVRVDADHRDRLRDHLLAERIGCEIYYPVPLHRQPCFADLGYRAGSLPHAEQAARETLALPVHPGLTAADQVRVVSAIAGYFGHPLHKAHSPVRGPAYRRRASAQQGAGAAEPLSGTPF
jgi:dTDP-4-amino-4,6-dideoxygalactose transaminase